MKESPCFICKEKKFLKDFDEAVKWVNLQREVKSKR
jgi:hypothetical protein